MDHVNNILVIGAGVSGLTTALRLAEETISGRSGSARRFHVQVLAERQAKDTVSTIAGALWEFPPAVCGHHGNEIAISRAERWCMDSYHRFEAIAKDYDPKLTGVAMREAKFYFASSIDDSRIERLKRQQLAALIGTFKPLADADLAKVPTSFGIKEGYKFKAPTIDTPIYTRWLLEQLKALPNVVFPAGPRITDRLVPQAAVLRRDYRADAIVNCTGMGAAELAGACMVPLRGALVRVPKKMWLDQSKVPQEAHAVAKSHSKQDMVFVVPRVDYVMFGGLAEPGEHDIHIGSDYPPIRAMFKRCQDFLPDVFKGFARGDNDAIDLDGIEIDVGIRPYRVENVCLEREYGFNIVHNYGHGGSGFTLSWGCANDIVGMLEGMELASFRTTTRAPTLREDAPSPDAATNGAADTSTFTVQEEAVYS